MGGFTALNTAVSGMRAAQLGLSVTGHNMSNAETEGYSRQRVTQRDYSYQRVGSSLNGRPLRVGMGTDTNAVMQIRNQFMDKTYRTQNSKLNFYAVKSTTGAEVENIIGEMQGAYNFQSVITDMWNALQEMSAHPQGVETRDYFLATCSSFINKANEVYESLFEYQRNLDGQIRDMVTEINDLVTRVKELNVQIAGLEGSGDYANDYRDERNLCLDQLSALIPIEYAEDSIGYVSIFTEGHQLLCQTSQNMMGLKYISGDYSFVEPIFTPLTHILPASTPPSEYESYLDIYKPVNAYTGNDEGALKALIVSRGAIPASYAGADRLTDPLKPNEIPDSTDTAKYPGGATDPQYLLDMRNFEKLYPDYVKDPAAYVIAIQDPLKLREYMRVYDAEKYTYDFNVWSLENGLIPKTQQSMDDIVHSIVTLINDIVAPALPDGSQDPDAPYDLYGQQSYVEIFVRKNYERWDENGNLIPETVGDYYSQYSIGNLQLNPLLLDTAGGYNWMAFSSSGDVEDNSVIKQILSEWKDSTSKYAISIGGNTYSIQDAYQKAVTALAIEINESNNFVETQSTQVVQADNKRKSVMSVSLDEELNHMMTYQYAYNAAARVFNVVDGMIDRIINQLGRSGL